MLIDVIDDSDIEFVEHFLVQLVDPPPFAVYDILLGTTTVEIKDNDGNLSDNINACHHRSVHGMSTTSSKLYEFRFLKMAVDY